MKKALIIVGVIVLILAGVGIGYALTHKPKPATTTTTTSASETVAPSTTTETTTPTASDDAATTETVITYSNGGFSPSTITVKNGTTVTIKNTSNHTMQFDSDPHPAHTTNAELNVEKVSAGGSQTFVVKRTGTFGYHNHLNPSETGTIIVQ